MKKLLYTASLALLGTITQAQVKVGDNPGTINGGSALEIESTNKGLLMPRVALTSTTTWGLAGTPTAGMSVYNTGTGLSSSNTAYPAAGVGEYYWDGTGWVSKKSGTQLGADNGLTVGYNSTGNVGLGGTLSKDTDIATGGKTVSFSGFGPFGLGTASPQRRLHLVNDGGGNLSDDILIQTYSTSATPGLFFYSAGGTAGSPTNIATSRLLGTVGSSGLVGGNETALSSIRFFYKGDGSTNLSNIDFLTSGNVSRMLLTENGNLGIGTATPGARLEVNNGTTAGAVKIVDGTQGANKILTSDANGVGTWQSPADIQIPTPAVYSLQSDISNFLNGVGSGDNRSVPMAQIVNSTGGNVAFNSGTNTISLKPGVYQMTFVYEATHDASGCTVSSYFVDFPTGTGSTTKRIHSTAAHNQGGTSNHGGTISFTTVITGSGYDWIIKLGRGQSGNCSGTGNTLAAGSTQLTVLRY
jgi:hypothetical protein